MNDEQKKKFQDNYQKCVMEMEQLERQFYEKQEKIEQIEQEISLDKAKGVLMTDMKEDIRTLEYEQEKIKREYTNLEVKALDASMGLQEKRRFVELDNSEKELFAILLREIKQEDLEKMRRNRWEEFPLDIRERIVELLDGLCTKEQWRPIGTGMELNMDIIEYKLLHPKEYRLFKVTEMMTSDVILQETKDNVLGMIDKKIFEAYKMLSKAISDIVDEVGDEELKKQMEEGIKRYQEIANRK